MEKEGHYWHISQVAESGKQLNITSVNIMHLSSELDSLQSHIVIHATTNLGYLISDDSYSKLYFKTNMKILVCESSDHHPTVEIP